MQAIDKFNGRKLRSTTIQRIENARTNPETGALEPGDDIDQMDRAFRARSVMNNIRKLSSSWPACAAGARRCCSSAKASTTTSTRPPACWVHRVVGPARHAGCDRRGHARQRQHLRHRSARAHHGDEDLITQSSTVGEA